MRLHKSIYTILLFLLFTSQIIAASLYMDDFNDGEPTLLPLEKVSAHKGDKQKNDQKHTLCIAAIFRNEAPWLREWIEYHNLLGVTKFYLYNNLSDDNYKQVLTPYITKGLVELIEWPYDSKGAENVEGTFNEIQVKAYRDALTRTKKSSTWLAIIDIDEFLVPVKNSTLTKLLMKYEDDSHIGGICLPWVVYGTSFVKKIPDDKLMIEMLVLNGGPTGGGDPTAVFKSGAFKSIVRPKYVREINSPHYCEFKSSRKHIMTAFDEAVINHYWTRDEDFLYNHKIPLRESWNTDVNTVLTWAAGLAQDTPYGRSILRFVPSLRNRMGLAP